MKRNFRVIFSAVFIALFLFLSFGLPPAGEGKEGEFQVKEGESGGSVALRLKEQGFIRSSFYFKVLLRLTGSSRSLKKGLYLLNDRQSAFHILFILSRGKIYTVRMTIPEGLNASQVGDLLFRKGLILSTKDFTQYVSSGNELYKRFSFIPSRNLEGFLYPDTYPFPKGLSIEEITLTMVRQFTNQVLAPLGVMIASNDLSSYDLLKLAALIEMEAVTAAERPLISQVFRKRLQRGIKLQCDPTVAYAVGKPPGSRLYYRDLRFDSPYNTYLYKGLTPAPICSPGKDSFQAAIDPAETDYLYFVSKNDGTHYFSRTLVEHNAAVDKYQRNN